jgi:hypothetical protein
MSELAHQPSPPSIDRNQALSVRQRPRHIFAEQLV